MNINKKLLSVQLKQYKLFSIMIADIPISVSFYWPMSFTINIAYVVSLITKITQTINTRKIKIIISKTSLGQKITQIINTRKIKLLATMKQSMKAVVVNYLRIRMTIVSKARQKAVVAMRFTKISFTWSPVYVILNLLSLFDPETLATLDVLTLGEMDYTTV